MIKNIQNIIEGFQSSSDISQEILLDILNDLITISLPQNPSGDNPETRAINSVLGNNILSFKKIFDELFRKFPNHFLRVFSVKKYTHKYSETIQKLIPEISIHEIEYYRKLWIEILIEKEIVREIRQKNFTLDIILSEKEGQEIQKIQENIEKQFQEFCQKIQQNPTDLELFFLAYKTHEIRNLRDILKKPQKQIMYFDHATHILYIDAVQIDFSRKSLASTMMAEFFKNPNEKIYYWDFFQKYDDRNISEKNANQKGSTLVTKINQKIQEKTQIKVFFSRGKGYFYQKNAE